MTDSPRATTMLRSLSWKMTSKRLLWATSAALSSMKQQWAFVPLYGQQAVRVAPTSARRGQPVEHERLAGMGTLLRS